MLTTVQQIADEFGVTRPTIYRHLGTTQTGAVTSARVAPYPPRDQPSGGSP
ncbi:MAG: helix-turn-helix domain-containing protein [Streptosporangiaceae bacterium]